jgi:hypothetical protein
MSKTKSYLTPRRSVHTEIDGHKLYWECHGEAAGVNTPRARINPLLEEANPCPLQKLNDPTSEGK